MSAEFWCPNEGDVIDIQGEYPDFCPWCGDTLLHTHQEVTA